MPCNPHMEDRASVHIRTGETRHERKGDRTRGHLRRSDGRKGVLCIGVAQDKARVLRTEQRHDPERGRIHRLRGARQRHPGRWRVHRILLPPRLRPVFRPALSVAFYAQPSGTRVRCAINAFNDAVQRLWVGRPITA